MKPMPDGLVITGDERGLLRGVLASPEDVTARLVYADWLDDHDDPRGPWLRAVCEGRDADHLRAAVNPNWAALFDRTSHFTVLLTAEIVQRLRKTVPVGSPLQKLSSRSTVQSNFRLAKVKPGDHVYPIQLEDGRVRVLTRFRVKELRSPFAHAADGGLVDYDRTLPQPVLERLRYVNRSGERGVSCLDDGRLTNVTTIHGVFRLAPGSARDFATLVFDPDLLSDLPAPPQPKKKRK